jgi:hypothetical protein
LQSGVDIGASTKHTLATGVHFPISDDARKSLEKLRAGAVTYVQLVRVCVSCVCVSVCVSLSLCVSASLSLSASLPLCLSASLCGDH